MTEVWPNQFGRMSVALLWVAAHYDIERGARTSLRRASRVLWELHRTPSIAPVDLDRERPLLARANDPSDEDWADLAAARRLLAGDMRTASVAEALHRLDHWPEYASIAGWRWLRAAAVLLGPRTAEDARGSLPYLAGIARGFREADRDRPPDPRDAPAVSVADLKGLFDG